MKRRYFFRPKLGEHSAIHIFVDASFHTETKNGAYGAVFSTHPNPPARCHNNYILTTMTGYLANIYCSGDAELMGIYNVLHALIIHYNNFSRFQHVTIYTDCHQVKREIYHYAYSESRPTPQRNHYIWKEIRLLLDVLREKYATINFQWVKGHNGTILNEMCDEIARETYGGRKGEG